MNWPDLIGPALGVAGVPLGLLLGEYLRRMQRAEKFATAIFEKRLQAYETMMQLIHEGSTIATEVINNTKLSAEARHDLISAAIEPIAHHADQSIFYIDDDLGAHCTALFMGVEDFQDKPDDERQELIEDYHEQVRETRRMILEDSGAIEVKKLFHAINRPNISSPVIDRIRELSGR